MSEVLQKGNLLSDLNDLERRIRINKKLDQQEDRRCKKPGPKVGYRIRQEIVDERWLRENGIAGFVEKGNGKIAITFLNGIEEEFPEREGEKYLAGILKK